jgi:hypothetical protein
LQLVRTLNNVVIIRSTSLSYIAFFTFQTVGKACNFQDAAAAAITDLPALRQYKVVVISGPIVWDLAKM